MNLVKIKFAPNLVELIKNGSKTLTYRLGDKFDILTIGEKVTLTDNESVEFAEAEIIEKFYETFSEIPLKREGHEPYDSEDQKSKKFEGYYKRTVSASEKAIVLRFRIIKFK